jgi:hypothetical protein
MQAGFRKINAFGAHFPRPPDYRRQGVIADVVRVIAVQWPAPGSEETELGIFMGSEVGHGETKIHTGVQA